MKTFIVRPNLIFVGQVHGKKVSLPPQIKAAAEKYGAWYEGDGGDKIQGISYKGSWDDAAAKDIKGYPKHFLFVIFTNTAKNKQKEILLNLGYTLEKENVVCNNEYFPFEDWWLDK